MEKAISGDKIMEAGKYGTNTKVYKHTTTRRKSQDDAKPRIKYEPVKKFKHEEEKEFVKQLKELKVDGIWNKSIRFKFLII